jgi:hypothetical protein
VRELATVLMAARNDTVPLPLPLLPDEIVSQGAVLDAVHWQPGEVETATEPLAPFKVGVTGPRAIL